MKYIKFLIISMIFSASAFADNEYSLKEKELDMCLQKEKCSYMVSGWAVGKGILNVYMTDDLYQMVGNDNVFLRNYYLDFLNYHNEKTLLLLSPKISSGNDYPVYEIPIFSNKRLMDNVRNIDTISIQNFDGTESRKTIKVK